MGPRDETLQPRRFRPRDIAAKRCEVKKPCWRGATFPRLGVICRPFALFEESVGEQTIERAIQLSGQDPFAIGVRQSLNQRSTVGTALGQSQQDAVRQIFERQEIEGVTFHEHTLLTKCEQCQRPRVFCIDLSALPMILL